MLRPVALAFKLVPRAREGARRGGSGASRAVPGRLRRGLWGGRGSTLRQGRGARQSHTLRLVGPGVPEPRKLPRALKQRGKMSGFVF